MEAACLAEAHAALAAAVAAGGGSPQLRCAAPRLFRDSLAVLSGLRPGFMLDYGTLPAVQLAAAVGALLRALRLEAGCLVVAEWHDCCFLVQPDLLAARAEVQQDAEALEDATALRPAAGTPGTAPNTPLLICFGEDGGGGCVRPEWVSPVEQAAAARELAEVGRRLRRATEAQRGRTSPRRSTSSAAAPSSGPGQPPLADAAPLLPVVDLAALACPLAMPTIAGFLLGYPALYLVRDQDGAQRAARCLSSASLQLHTATTRLQLPPPGGTASRDDGQAPLAAFSVPTELAGAPSWHRAWEAWGTALQRAADAARAAGFPWGPLELRAAVHPPRPVAL